MKEKYDLVINPGIAGSYSKDLNIGTVVKVANEQFGDLGIDDNSKFRTLFEMGYDDMNSPPFTNGKLINTFEVNKFNVLKTLPEVNGLTVNLVSGNHADTNRRQNKFKADIETMEGAGVFYVCLQQNIPFIELRAISNKVGPRDFGNWNIPLAIQNLSETMFKLFVEIEQTDV